MVPPTDICIFCRPLQVYQVVRKIVEDQGEKDQVRLTVPVLYDSIKRSNSSLNRRPKRLLEDSLERVVELVKLDLFGEDEEDSVEGDFEGLEEQPSQVCGDHRCLVLVLLQETYYLIQL